MGFFNYSLQEEPDPFNPRSSLADPEELVHIRVAVSIKVRTKIQERFGQILALCEQKNDEEPSYAPVPVDEWMEGFELVVDEREPDEEWQVAPGVKEFFETIHPGFHGFDGWRHESCLMNRLAWVTNEVLTISEFARATFLAPHVG